MRFTFQWQHSEKCPEQHPEKPYLDEWIRHGLHPGEYPVTTEERQCKSLLAQVLLTQAKLQQEQAWRAYKSYSTLAKCAVYDWEKKQYNELAMHALFIRAYWTQKRVMLWDLFVRKLDLPVGSEYRSFTSYFELDEIGPRN